MLADYRAWFPLSTTDELLIPPVLSDRNFFFKTRPVHVQQRSGSGRGPSALGATRSPAASSVPWSRCVARGLTVHRDQGAGCSRTGGGGRLSPPRIFYLSLLAKQADLSAFSLGKWESVLARGGRCRDFSITHNSAHQKRAALLRSWLLAQSLGPPLWALLMSS